MSCNLNKRDLVMDKLGKRRFQTKGTAGGKTQHRQGLGCWRFWEEAGL